MRESGILLSVQQCSELAFIYGRLARDELDPESASAIQLAAVVAKDVLFAICSSVEDNGMKNSTCEERYECLAELLRRILDGELKEA
jgi:hypothetical protein